MRPVIKILLFLVATIILNIRASASDGTINFEGNIVKQTCLITVNGIVAPTEATIILPTVSVGLLNAPGKTAGRTHFLIELSQCSGPTLRAAAFFEGNRDVDPVSGHLVAYTVDVDNLRLQLLDMSGTPRPIKAGDSSQLSNTTKVFIGTGKATLKYAVEYFATGVTTPGWVLAMATYSIHYQ